MLHHYTIWKLMRRRTSRQIESDGVRIVAEFLEDVIEDITANCELLLSYNGTKKSRISTDCVKSVIKDKSITYLSNVTGGNLKRKEKNNLHLPNEV